MENMIMEYRAILENLEISQFAQLLQKAKKTAQSVRPSSKKQKDRKSALQAITISTSKKRKRQMGGSTRARCTFRQMDHVDGVSKPNQFSRESTEEE